MAFDNLAGCLHLVMISQGLHTDADVLDTRVAEKSEFLSPVIIALG